MSMQAYPQASLVEPPRGDGLPPLDIPPFDVSALASIMQNVENAAQNPGPPDLQAILQSAGVKPLASHSQGMTSGQAPVDPRTRGGNGAPGMEAPTLAGDEGPGPDVGSSLLALMKGFL